MKKYLFSIAAVIALGFSACTPDEPNTDDPAVSSIVAKWEVTDVTTRVQDSMTGGMLLDTTIIQYYAANELVLDFRANGVVISIFGGNTESSDTTPYTYTAPILKIYEDIEDFEEFTVTFSGNNVMLKGKPMYQTIEEEDYPIPITVKVTNNVNAKKE